MFEKKLFEGALVEGADVPELASIFPNEKPLGPELGEPTVAPDVGGGSDAFAKLKAGLFVASPVDGAFEVCTAGVLEDD